jgi:hypothetical protein
MNQLPPRFARNLEPTDQEVERLQNALRTHLDTGGSDRTPRWRHGGVWGGIGLALVVTTGLLWSQSHPGHPATGAGPPTPPPAQVAPPLLVTPSRAPAAPVPLPVRPEQTAAPRVAPPAAPKEPPSSAAEAAAAFAAILDMAQQGSSETALLAKIRAFRTDFKDSVFDAEALTLALEVEAVHGNPTEVGDKIGAYLAAHPHSPRRHGLLQLRAQLHRDQRDCALALRDYRVLARETQGADAARAQAWRGLCARELGLLDEAAEALTLAEALGLTGALSHAVAAALFELTMEEIEEGNEG